MGTYKHRNAYRTTRHIFVPIDASFHPEMRKHTGCSQAKAFYAVVDTIPGPVGRHVWHLTLLADALGITVPYIGEWKGMPALVIAGNARFALAKVKGVRSVALDEEDDVLMSYHAYDMGVKASEILLKS